MEIAFACFAGFVLLGGMLIGTVIVRAAVAIANQMIGPVKVKWESIDLVSDWDWDEEPEKPQASRNAPGDAIPKPGFGKGMMIASTANVLTAFIGGVLGVLFEELFGAPADTIAGVVVLVLLASALAFACLTLLLVPMLPTTFWRSAQVAFIYYIILLGLVSLITGGLVALDAVLG